MPRGYCWLLLHSRSHSKTHRQDRGSSPQAWGQTRPSIPHYRTTVALEKGGQADPLSPSIRAGRPFSAVWPVIPTLKYSVGAQAGSSRTQGGATGTCRSPTEAAHQEVPVTVKGTWTAPIPLQNTTPGCSHRGQHQGWGHVPYLWSGWPWPASGQM